MARIEVDYGAIRTVANQIANKDSQLTEITDILSKSQGDAADKEKEVIDILSAICTVTFPQMLTSTSTMLNEIAAAFERADKKLGGIPDTEDAKGGQS